MSHSTGKILNIQALRGMAVLLVVALHLASNEEKYAHGYHILPGWFRVGSLGVDIFFVVSGFVMATITRGRFQKPGAVPQFLYHRVTRIYPPYWLYTLLMLGIVLAQRGAGGPRRTVDIAASLLLWPQDQLPILVVGWTLVHEIYFYLVFSFLLFFREHWLLPLLVVWGAVCVIGGWIGQPVESPLVRVATSPLTLEFIAGALIAGIVGSGRPALYWLLCLAALAWWSLGYGLAASHGVTPESSAWLRVLVFGVPAAVLVYAAAGLEKACGWQLPAWLIAVGDTSYSIYLSHLLIIGAIGRIWEKTGFVGPGVNGMVLAVMVASILAYGRFSFRYLERPALRAAHRLEGVVRGIRAD